MNMLCDCLYQFNPYSIQYKYTLSYDCGDVAALSADIPGTKLVGSAKITVNHANECFER